MKTNKTNLRPENRDGQPRMTRMKRNSAKEHSEASRTESQEWIPLLIRVIREIRGFSFGTWLKNLFLLPALIAVLNFMPAGRVTAQTFTTLHSFTGDGA